MARLPRVSPPGMPQHIIQRGNNRQVCFADSADFAAYADWLYEASQKYQVAVHAWVFMHTVLPLKCVDKYFRTTALVPSQRCQKPIFYLTYVTVSPVVIQDIVFP